MLFKTFTAVSRLFFASILMGSSLANAGSPPIYASVTFKTTAANIGADQCVTRIDPPSTTGFQYQADELGTSSRQEEGSLAGYLSLVANPTDTWDGLMAAIGYEKYVSIATKTMSLPFVVQDTQGVKTLLSTDIQALISPVRVGNTDASALTLGYFLPVLDDVDDQLLGLPEAIRGIANGAISAWNQVVNEAKQSRQAKATLKASEVTEQKVQSAMEIMGGAQGVLLVQYACDGQDVNKYATALTTYLGRLTSAVKQFNQK